MLTVSASGASNSPQKVRVRLEVAPGRSGAMVWVAVFLAVAGVMLLIIMLGRRRRRA